MGQKREFVSDNLELISRLSHDFGYGVSSYTNEEKRLVVSYYLSNKCQAKAICERFNICKKNRETMKYYYNTTTKHIIYS